MTARIQDCGSIECFTCLDQFEISPAVPNGTAFFVLKRMKLIGITGGIGMGKSTAAELLRAEQGVAVIDTDEIARQVVEPRQKGWELIFREFGADVFFADSTINRKRLAEIVFGNDSARRKLETLLHPLIRARWMEEVELQRARGATVCFVVIPLLFETGAEDLFDAAVCVACSGDVQNERLRERGWSSNEIAARLRAQLPVKDKIERADHVVWTDGTIEMHRLQWLELLSRWRD